MEYTGEFDFFYGKESERYHFITVPKLLFSETKFKGMSAEAKILYGCLLDRNSLSQKNGWVDELNRVYVLYTIENMKQDLGCASEKVNKVLKELEIAGLIYRKHNGIGKKNYIYVMDYMAYYRKEASCIRKSKTPCSKIESERVRFSKSNKTNANKKDLSKCIRGPDRVNNASTRSKNVFCNFPQRDYDFEKIEELLLDRHMVENKEKQNSM